MTENAIDKAIAALELKWTAPEIDLKDLREFGHQVVSKVVCANTVQGFGDDLMTRVYLAGLYHGVTLEREKKIGS